MKSSRAVCILGMHRSGTSMISRSVNLLGVNLGEPEKLLGKAKANPKGFWEYRKITQSQEKLLKVFKHRWYSTKPLPSKWWEHSEAKPIQKHIKKIIKTEFYGEKLWGWKDPRNSLLLPMWKEIQTELDFDLSFIIMVRNPLDVAASLSTRNQFSVEKSVRLWAFYTLSALIWTAKENRVIIEYDDFLEDWESQLRKISNTLLISWPKNEKRLQHVMKRFVEKDLQHSRSSVEDLEQNENVPEWVVTIYKLVLKAKGSEDFLSSDAFTVMLREIYKQQFAS
jgi:hypothetical protein